MDRDSLSPTSTSSNHSITDKRIYLLGSHSSGLVRCGIADESSNEGQNSVHEQSCQSHDSVKEIDGYGQPDKNTNTGDEDNLCFISSKSFQRTRKKDTKQQKHYFTTKNASQAPLSFWPHWAYEMYDSYSLSRRAAGTMLFLHCPLFVISLDCSKRNLCYSPFIDC
jgi:cereblon